MDTQNSCCITLENSVIMISLTSTASSLGMNTSSVVDKKNTHQVNNFTILPATF